MQTHEGSPGRQQPVHSVHSIHSDVAIPTPRVNELQLKESTCHNSMPHAEPVNHELLSGVDLNYLCFHSSVQGRPALQPSG